MKKNGKFVKRPNQHLRRFYTGKKRFNGSRIRHSAKYLAWALDLKPGDYVATCEGCNRQVKEVKIVWGNHAWWEWRGEQSGKKRKMDQHDFLYEIDVIDTNGRSHSVGSCCFPKETREQVIAYFKEDWNKEMEVDEFGEIHKFPQFDVFANKV